jgi:hypothetical protein
MKPKRKKLIKNSEIIEDESSTKVNPIINIDDSTLKTETSEQKSSKNSDNLFKSKLDELKVKLNVTFKPSFTQTIIYLIQIENEKQDAIEKMYYSDLIDWTLLTNCLNKLKCICKNKHHLKIIIVELLPIKCTTNETEPMSSSKASKISIEDKKVDETIAFSLPKVLIRLLFKLIKLSMSSNFIQLNEKNEQKKVFKFQLLLISCLADLCYYEEMRLELINDSNLKHLFDLYIIYIKSTLNQIKKKLIPSTSKVKTTTTSNESILSPTTVADSIEKVKSFWIKMCRFVANMFLEKHDQNVRVIITNDFFSSLCECLEFSSNNSHKNSSISNNLDLYFSITRLLKYGSRIVQLKNLIIENRLIVYICKFLSTLYKSTCSSSQLNTETLSKNQYYSPSQMKMSREFIRQCLLLIDNWPPPLNYEFYNQVNFN